MIVLLEKDMDVIFSEKCLSNIFLVGLTIHQNVHLERYGGFFFVELVIYCGNLDHNLLGFFGKEQNNTSR